MSVTIALADGRQAVIDGGVSADGRGLITFQFLSAAGAPLGPPATIAESDPPGFQTSPVVNLVATQDFTAAALSDGGFEVAYRQVQQDNEGLGSSSLLGVHVSAAGAVAPATFLGHLEGLDRGGGEAPSDAQLTALGGDRVAAVFDETDPFISGAGVHHHVVLATAQSGAYADLAVDAGAGAVTEAPGDITISWTENGSTLREVLGDDGAVLMARGVSHTFDVKLEGGVALPNFDVAHDQLRLENLDGSILGGAHTTLTYVVGSHTLLWDPDSEGSAPAVTAAVLPSTANTLTAANFTDDFRPAVLKIVSPVGAQDITWFDTDGTQPWDTLHATYDIHGLLTTYGSTLDDGTGERFTFDADFSQPWTRYVDELDPAGHVTQRTVLYDDGTSWTAKFAYSGGQVVSYEVDNFDAAGRQVGTSFFHADGTPL